MQPYELSLAAAAREIRERRLSPVELVDSVLDRIEQVEPHIAAYVSVLADQARRTARDAEREAVQAPTEALCTGFRWGSRT